MANTFMNALKNEYNYDRTQNGALAHKTTCSKVYDMFALGGAYRQRSDEDCILLFKEAYRENKTLATKCLFYLRDCRGGQGERRFFRVCFRWLCNNYPEHARQLLIHVSEYGRWDDLIYCAIYTPVEKDMLKIIDKQLTLDLDSKTPSLLAKWMPSENASSYKTQMTARHIINKLDGKPKYYRKALSVLRKRINIVERLMSENRWDEIEFDKLPSKAGIVYKNAFARRDIIAKKYEKFAKSDKTTVNAATLFPYEVVNKVTSAIGYGGSIRLSDVDRAMINKYWANLPDYFEGKPASMMCVIDTSGSMTWSGRGQVKPMDIAISLGLYSAERIGGPFNGHYISFASRPQLIETRGIDFCDKVQRIYRTNLCDNTNLTAVFDMLLNTIKSNWEIRTADIPKTIVIISDMQIDQGLNYYYSNRGKNHVLTEMESIRQKWNRAGYQLPNLVYWNVNASKDTFLDLGPGVSYCSGCSPSLFKQVMTGKTGYDLMLDAILNKRYEVIK